jgi:transposase-like protein
MFLLLQSMKTSCPECNSDNFRVIKTYPCEDHTLRHLKCRACGGNLFTHEYIMQRDEYSWTRIGSTTKLRLKQQ